MSELNKFCDHMRELHRRYNAEKSSANLDSDKIIALNSKITVLETLLQEAAFIKRETQWFSEREEDVGC
jgi:hypothetical protein